MFNLAVKNLKKKKKTLNGCRDLHAFRQTALGVAANGTKINKLRIYQVKIPNLPVL
jgi:hypothetical protein